MTDTKIRIGTRGSPLALIQAEEVRYGIIRAHDLAPEAVEIVVIKVTGDQIQDKALREFGGKGLFTKEIEEAVLSGEVTMAVHSMKDVPTQSQEGLGIACILQREDPRDGFISLKHKSLADMPAGATLGTSSLRRQAQAKRMRPDLEVVNFRGNVQTRMRKLGDGVADATFLAVAGLNRLGNQEHITEALEPDTMLPAIAQGAVGIEIRAVDDATRELIAPLHHEETNTCVTAERAFLARLDGSCRTPIAGHATLANGQLAFTGEMLLPDGTEHYTVSASGPAFEARAIGTDAAERILADAGPEFLARIT